MSGRDSLNQLTLGSGIRIGGNIVEMRVSCFLLIEAPHPQHPVFDFGPEALLLRVGDAWDMIEKPTDWTERGHHLRPVVQTALPIPRQREEVRMDFGLALAASRKVLRQAVTNCGVSAVLDQLMHDRGEELRRNREDSQPFMLGYGCAEFLMPGTTSGLKARSVQARR